MSEEKTLPVDDTGESLSEETLKHLDGCKGGGVAMEEQDKEPTAEQLQAIEDMDEGCPDGWEEGRDA